MNWHLSRLGLAVLFCVAVFCVVLVGFFWFWFFGFLLVFGDGLPYCAQVHYQFTLEAPQSADGHMYALIN